MRRLLLTLLCLCWPCLAHAITIVQTAHGGITNSAAATASGTATFGSTPTNGNTIIAAFTFRDATGASYTSYTNSVTATNLTFTQKTNASPALPFLIYDNNSSVLREYGFYLYTAPVGASAGTAITCNLANGVSIRGGGCFVWEVSGNVSSLLATATTYQDFPSAGCTSGNLNSGNGTGGLNVNPGSISYTAANGPFVMSLVHLTISSATPAVPTNTHYLAMTDNATNDSFTAIYAVVDAVNFSSPDLIGWTASAPAGCGTLGQNAIVLGAAAAAACPLTRTRMGVGC